MRGENRDRLVWPLGLLAGYADRALPVGQPCFLGRRQRVLHRGQTAIRRLRKSYRKAVLVHTPVHASWLNQVEIYFSIIQRKVLTPNDFASLEEVEQRLRLYEELSNRTPRPFQWKFDRAALQTFLAKLRAKRALVSSASDH